MLVQGSASPCPHCASISTQQRDRAVGLALGYLPAENEADPGQCTLWQTQPFAPISLLYLRSIMSNSRSTAVDQLPWPLRSNVRDCSSLNLAIVLRRCRIPAVCYDFPVSSAFLITQFPAESGSPAPSPPLYTGKSCRSWSGSHISLLSLLFSSSTSTCWISDEILTDSDSSSKYARIPSCILESS